MRAVALAALALAAACSTDAGTLPPRGQLLIYVTTDAPLPPRAGGTLPPGSAPPLFDSVAIDVLSPAGACEGCSRRFAIDRDMVEGGLASFGVLPPIGAAGYRVRIRIFRAIAQLSGEPIESAALTATITLPPVPAEGITQLTVDLPTDSVGVPFEAQAKPGLPPKGHVGTWAPALPKDCAGAPGPGESCVPGGAYWMGNPEVVGALASVDASTPRLVTLSPFMIDQHEVIVSDFRSSGVRRTLGFFDLSGKPVKDPQDSYDPSGPSGFDICTFASVSNGVTDSLPVNCLTWTIAREYCQKLGKDLPTEAQWEYVAGGLRSATFPWGEDTPSCESAVFARDAHPDLPVTCIEGTNGRKTPALAGTGTLDRVPLRGGDVTDLAGNLREYVRDRFQPNGGDCWSAPLLADPICDHPSGLVVVRGGSFRDEPGFLRAATRHFDTPDGDVIPSLASYAYYVDDNMPPTPNTPIGFRCVRELGP